MIARGEPSTETLERLRSARSMAVLTGAGISAESGVPTFRGENGLWKKFRPEELATMEAFLRNPELVWDWYQHRRQLLEVVQPNLGHLALFELENIVEDFTLITQNIDGLHQKAGSRGVIELHGNIGRNRCISCGQVFHEAELESDQVPPRCRCGSNMRPDVVWFGELLPRQALESAFAAAERCSVFISVGTSALVQPAASLPLHASRHGAYTIEVNLEPTPLSDLVNESILGLAGKILPDMVRRLRESEDER